MEKSVDSKDSNAKVQLAIDVTIKIGVLLLLLIWCFQIISPFISIVVWAVIIAVSFYPLFNALMKKMGGRRKLAAIIISLLSITVIIVPTVIFTNSLTDGIKNFKDDLENKSLEIPPPPDDVADWPLVGEAIYGTWQLASENMLEAVEKYEEQLLQLGNWLVKALMSTGMGILQFILSIIIAGILLAASTSGVSMVRKLFRRLVGEKGDEFANISEVTVRNVTKGVLGVAVIQSFLAGIVFMLAGIPYAGLWALLSLILCVIQLGPGLIIIPVIIYLYSTSEPWFASLWTVALVLVMLSDNILKPILMGKGAPVPILVIFLGSLGGFISFGFIGLFLGAIVLSLGYKLFIAWVEEAHA